MCYLALHKYKVYVTQKIAEVKETVLIFLLTPWSRVLPEKLAGPQLARKFPAFYGTRRFITACTTARHPSLS